MSRLVVVSNRVPSPKVGEPQAGGLAIALRNALTACGGLWFGWNGQVKSTPQQSPRSTHSAGIDYATLALTRPEHRDYYLGYANEVLWPVFHFHLGNMDFRREYQHAYRSVNERFAEALVPLLEDDDIVWVHDYHFIPFGGDLRARGVRQRLGFFLHTPFPSYNLIRALPGYRDRLAELCQYDLVGFQTRDDELAFEESMARTFGSGCVVDGAVRLGDRIARTGVYPVGVDVEEATELASRAVTATRVRRLIHNLDDRDLIVGVDRLDYSKGLPNRVRAFATLLRDHEHRRGHTVLMQIASPSRIAIPEYNRLRRQLERLCGHINGNYGYLDWVPVHYLNRTFARASLMGLYRAAQIGLVTPLRDGMNLVAKEFVAAQNPQSPGVLVLSELAGAARELDGAIQVNPYDVDGIAAGLDTALAMPLAERRQRHEQMMETLRRNSIQRWHQRFLDDLRVH